MEGEAEVTSPWDSERLREEIAETTSLAARPSDWPAGGGGGGGGEKLAAAAGGRPGGLVGPLMDDEDDEDDEDLGLALARDSEPRLVLNVGGVRHETRVSTLMAIPDTRLSRLAHAHTRLVTAPPSPSPSPADPSPSPLLTTPTPTLTLSGPPALLALTEYFFDRHPAVFNSVIDFYRTGESGVLGGWGVGLGSGGWGGGGGTCAWGYSGRRHICG